MVLHIHKHIQTYLHIKTDNPKDSQIKHSVISEIPNPIKIENPTNTKHCFQNRTGPGGRIVKIGN